MRPTLGGRRRERGRSPSSSATAARGPARPRRRPRPPRGACARSARARRARRPRARPRRRRRCRRPPRSAGGSTPSRGGGAQHQPGRRLAAGAAVVRAVRADLDRRRAGRAAPRRGAFTRVDLLRGSSSPRAMPLWLETTPIGTPARAQAVERLAGARHRLDPLRVAVVGHVGDQRPVAVEQDRLGARPRRGRAARAPAARRPTPYSHQRRGGERHRRARPQHRRDLVAACAGPGAIRAQASSAVPAAHAAPAAAAARRRPARGGAERREPGAGGERVARRGGPAARRRARASRGRAARASARRRRCRPAWRATRPPAAGRPGAARERSPQRDPPARGARRAARGRRPRGRRAGSARRSRRPRRAPSRR